VALLAGVSALFYAINARRALGLLIVIAAVDFTTTRLMASTEGIRRRRLLLAISLVTDIGALCFFKYANFFLDSVASVTSSALLRLDIVVPLGISFFIFQSLAYVIDVYRRDAEPAPGFIDYFAFVAFFPTIVAGPIVRARDLLHRLRGR